MNKTLLVVGYGPGISHAVAEKFGKEGFQLALVARNAGKLSDAVKTFGKQGIRSEAFAADVGDSAELKRALQSVREKLGPLTVVHWNAASLGATDLLTASPGELATTFAVGVTGLITVVQDAIEDLKKAGKDAAVLVTNGGFGLFDTNVDAVGVKSKNMGLAIGNAAKHKTVRLLSQRLAPEGIYVGEVMVVGTVKGTAWDQGDAKIEASGIAGKFWELYTSRAESLVKFG